MAPDPLATAATPMLRVYLLGALRIERDTQTIRLPTRKVESLLAFLVLHPEPHPREKLAALLWGDSSDELARRSLRTALTTIRKALGDDILLADRETVQLNPEVPMSVDAREIGRLEIGDSSIANLQSLISLYSADLLPDFYDDWILPERERLRSLYLDTLLQLARHARAESKYPQAMEFAQKVLATDPTNEKAYQHRIFCSAALGDRIGALKQYDECERKLRDELGVEPSKETIALRDRIEQELTGSTSREALLTNLPHPLTSFIGREREIAEVKGWLDPSGLPNPKGLGTRLLTLTGSGGCGKTRLAIEVAADLVARYANGAWFVDLAPLVDPALIPQAVASALGVQEHPGRTLSDTLQDLLCAKQMLIILDNCEHLRDACAQFAHALLTHCPNLEILATSREALKVPGEVTWLVPSLSLPAMAQNIPTEELIRYEAVRLFAERAGAAQGAQPFALTNQNAASVVQICRRLDGMPLAIELAAARVRILTVAQIAARLDDAFRLLTRGGPAVLPRQQMLRATIEWSYNLLSEPARVLFRRLAVFAGGFTIEAAETIASEGELPPQVFDALTELVEKSILVADTAGRAEARYRMLETIRQYARDRLLESGDAEPIRNRHLDFFMLFAEQVEPKLHGAEQMQWLERLDLDYDNLRAALDWSLGAGRVEKGLRLGAALAWFWERRGYWSEARERLQSLLNRPEAAPKTLIRAKGLLAVSLAANLLAAAWVGGSHASRPYLEEVIAIAREHGPAGQRLCALALTFSSNILHANNPTLAQSEYDDAWAIVQELNEPWISALLLHQRAHWYEKENDYQAARKAFEDSMMFFHSVGDRRWEAILFSDIAQLSFEQGDYEDARRRLGIILPYFRQTKDRQHICFALLRLGQLARAEGNYAVAKEYAVEGLGLARELGSKLQINSLTADMGFVAIHDGELDSARTFFVECLATARELDIKVRFATALVGFACIAVAGKQVRQGVQLFAFVDNLLEGRIQRNLHPGIEVEFKRYLAMARGQVDAVSFNAAWAKGRAMPLEQAIEYALQLEPVSEASTKLPPPAYPAGLTEREVDVLRWLAQGLSNQEIADRLVLSKRTVHAHLRSIYAKLDVTTRSAATRVAIDNKMV